MPRLKMYLSILLTERRSNNAYKRKYDLKKKKKQE